jgi:hypothetical protein
MSDSRRLAVAALLLAGIACVIAGVAWWDARRHLAATPGNVPREGERAAADTTLAPSLQWLNGTPEAKFAQIEKHLRGLDQAMAEIGYRYGELLFAARERNWEYARYQAEKIDLSLRLALERRPKRVPSAQPFLNEDLPAVLTAIQSQDPLRMERAMERLHDACVACHRSENVLHFRGAVERLRAANR